MFRCPWQSRHAHSREHGCISSCPLDKFGETNGPDLCRMWSGMHKLSNSHRCYYYETLLVSLGKTPIVHRWLWCYQVPLQFVWCTLVKPWNIKLQNKLFGSFANGRVRMLEWGGEIAVSLFHSYMLFKSVHCLPTCKAWCISCFWKYIVAREKYIQIKMHIHDALIKCMVLKLVYRTTVWV